MNQSTKGMILTIAGGTCWGLSGILGKYLFDVKNLNAVWLVTFRLSVSGLIILLLAYAVHRARVFYVWKRRDSAVRQLVFCFLGMAPCQMTFFLAVQYSNPGTATVLQYLAPVIILLFCLILERRLPKFTEAAVLTTVMVGIFLLVTHGNIGNLSITSQALFWGITSALTCVIYTVQPKKLLAEFGTLETTGWGMFIGGLVLCPVVRIWEVPGIWDYQTVLLLAGVIIIGTVISFTCYLRGVFLLGPIKGSMFGCVEPVIATVCSALLLGENFAGMDLLGMFCIVAGVTALAVFEKRDAASAKTAAALDD